MTIDRLLENTDDAYTFPPFASFAPLLAFGELDYAALRARERELLETVDRRTPGGSASGSSATTGRSSSRASSSATGRSSARRAGRGRREADVAVATEIAAAEAPVGAGRSS